MNESEQAQAIADIDAMISNWSAYCIGSFVNACENLRDLVDSQAQKIEGLERENIYLKRQAAIHNDLMAEGAELLTEKREKISEQAQEIERLKNLVRKAGGFEP